MRPLTLSGLLTVALIASSAAGCGGDASEPGEGGGAGGESAGGAAGAGGVGGSARARVAVVSDSVETRAQVEPMLRAALEMQLSGEPLAEAMGRDLAGYRRFDAVPDRYYGDSPEGRIDLPGYSAAVESYEYSKLAMNAVSFESGAAVSMAFGGLTNPDQKAGAEGSFKLRNELQFYAALSDATERYVWLTDPLDPVNPLGWPGIWPALHPFRSHDPAIAPVATFAKKCSLASDDTVTQPGVLSPDYECAYGSLRLVDRGAQIEPVVGPGPSGWLAWKQALWAANYLQVMHDRGGHLIAGVDEADLAKVGSHENSIAGTLADGSPGVPGTYLGSSDIEGLQAGLFLRALDNQAHDWLMALGTTDGQALSGFSSLDEAWHYGRPSPLRWLPRAIAVAEGPEPVFFPRPSYSIAEPGSRLLDLVGLLGAFAQAYAVTDEQNPAAGGQQAARAWFDDKPFAHDDPQVPAEPTLHDRSLAMIRFLLVTLDRAHRGEGGALCDEASLAGGALVPSGVSSAEAAAYAIVALREARLSLTHRLSLYANLSPDTKGATGALDDVPLGGEGETTVGALVDALIEAEAALLRDRLTTPEGEAYSRWETGEARGQGSLDAHAAAARGLYAAYLATGDASFRERAAAVVARMNARFWDDALAVYTEGPAPADSATYTPARFGLVQGALRDHYQLWASRPGKEAEAPRVLERLARLNKLVLNGWDDRDGDGEVDWPDECVRVEGGLPRGGLQMAERTLTGELGSADADPKSAEHTPTSDRDHDCVPEIDDARLPAQLAGSVTFRARVP